MRPDPDIVTHRHGCLDQRLSRNRAIAGAMVMIGDVAVRPDHALGADTYTEGCVEHRETIDIGAPANEQFRPRTTRSRREQDDLVIQSNHVVEGNIPRIPRHVDAPDPAFAAEANTAHAKPQDADTAGDRARIADEAIDQVVAQHRNAHTELVTQFA